MPRTVYASPQTLTLAPSNPWPQHPRTYPKEREVSREILLGVAPDRESLLLGGRSIHELRQVLKIRVGPTERPSHWLYRNRKRVNASLRDGNTRISTLIQKGPGQESSTKELHVLRRVLSAGALPPFTQPMRLDPRCLSPYGAHDIDMWGSVMLSTTEKLISPRPLGPTHILVVHSIPGPSRVFQPVTGGGRKPLRRKQSSPLSNVVEIPINDLLFALNVPNLAPAIPVLPPRLHKELPRVLMYVPHIDTFPELVVYLHTQNQAELMRKLIPEWIRDLMHPLPEPADSTASAAPPPLVDGKALVKTPLQLLGRLIPGAVATSGTETFSMVQYDPCPRAEFRRTVVSVAEEVAQAAYAASINDEKEAADPVLTAVAQLNALRDNLEYVGYFLQDLWHELDAYREVLIRAISCQAKIRADAEHVND
ncbi:hypothetical protein DXG01_016680 [Tephrocybe rancida]|nr:hypothetical protein DXG01_016680 [Tephrocybe rancida]